MFFYLSKLAACLADPGQVLLAGLIVALVLQVTRWRRVGQRLALVVAALLVLIGTLPLGLVLLETLEWRFPKPEPLPAHIDGIVVLGGSERTWLSHVHGQPSLNERAERLLIGAQLAWRFPAARLLFAGGSAKLGPTPLTEADVARQVFAGLGLDGARVLYDDRSRNTFENAERAYELARPKPGETWLLVTSASHMPRAIGCFRQVGWTITAYPVDFRSDGGGIRQIKFSLGGLNLLGDALHEWLGLLVYWLTGRSAALLPAP